MWYKRLTRSDALQPTRGGRMSFLRFTQGLGRSESPETLFKDLSWEPGRTRQDRDCFTATISITLTVEGTDKGSRQVSLQRVDQRADNHNAPAIHLPYDDFLTTIFEEENLAGNFVIFERAGHWQFKVSIQAAAPSGS